MRNLKKIFFISISSLLIVICILSFTNRTYADNAKVVISADKSNVEVGEKIGVNVTVSNHPSAGYDGDITYCSLTVNYDASLASYEGSPDGSVTGSGFSGVIPIEIAGGGDLNPEYSFKMVFVAKQAGKITFSPNVSQFVDLDANVCSPKCSPVSTQIWAKGSSDATLKSIVVAGANLEPAFNPGWGDYKCYVPNSCTQVAISAVSTMGGKVDMNGNPNNLKVGANDIIFTVHAPNGKTLPYKVSIIRMQPETTPAPTTQPPEDVEIKVGDKQYKIMSKFPAESVPEGFEIKLMDYKNKDAIGASDGNLELFYLVDTNGNCDFFVYDMEKDTFEKYIVISIGGKKYRICTLKENEVIPKGYKSGEYKTDELTFDAYISEKPSDFVLFYGAGEGKEACWYSFDTLEGTVQRLNTVDFSVQATTGKSDETTTAEETETSIEPETSSAFENEKSKENQRVKNSIFIVLIVLFVIMFVIVTALTISKTKERKKENSEEDENQISPEDDLMDEPDENAEIVTPEAPVEEAPVEETETEVPVEPTENAETGASVEPTETEAIPVGKIEPTSIKAIQNEIEAILAKEVNEMEVNETIPEKKTDTETTAEPLLEEISLVKDEQAEFKKEAEALTESIEDLDKPQIVSLDGNESDDLFL